MGGRGSSSGKAGSGVSVKKASATPAQNIVREKPKKVLPADTIRKYGFESLDELMDYAQWGFVASAPAFDRERREIRASIHPLLDGVAVLENANRGVNSSFVNYLKNNLDVGIDGYGNNSYLINLKRRGDGSKKRKRPKSAGNAEA